MRSTARQPPPPDSPDTKVCRPFGPMADQSSESDDPFNRKPNKKGQKPTQRNNPFFKELSSHSDQRDLSETLDGTSSRFPSLGRDDVSPNFDERITTKEKHISGAIPTPEEVLRMVTRKKEQDKKKDKSKPRGASYDPIKPGNKHNEPDPDEEPYDSRMDEY